ncbi:hypothetical protein TMatcc_000255, partial [Talaromyces marneffei ATCC 18224]
RRRETLRRACGRRWWKSLTAINGIAESPGLACSVSTPAAITPIVPARQGDFGASLLGNEYKFPTSNTFCAYQKRPRGESEAKV